MKLFLKIILGLILVLTAAFGYWRYDHTDRENQVDPAALVALESDDQVTVSEDGWFIFEPVNSAPTKGLIFYPGGEVDERGYAEPLREIAAAGYLVVMVPMPFQLAVFSIESAAGVIASYPQIESWAIAGHSLGGSMAARYIHHHPGEIAGLILWDSYPADDMSTATDLKVRMIHRADENGATPEDYGPYLYRLPEQTDYVALEGGNHLNFGRFIAGRMYRGEPPAALDADQQRKRAAAASIDFMNRL